MLNIENLSFSYGRKSLFNSLDLQVGTGLFGLLGKNGAGKTTLLRLISGNFFLTAESAGQRVLMHRSGFRQCFRRFFICLRNLSCGMTGMQYIESYSPFYPRFSEDFFRNCTEEFKIDLRLSWAPCHTGRKRNS